MASTMLPTKAFPAPGRREAGRFVAAPDHDVGRVLDLFDLVTVDDLLVAGEHRPPWNRSARKRCPMENKHRIAETSADEQHGFLRRRFVGVPVGPIRMTGSPGFNSAQRSDDPPISSTMVERSPCSSIDRSAGQREAFHGERRAIGARRERLEILQAIELPRLEGTRGERSARRSLRRYSASAATTVVHHGAQFVVHGARRVRAGDGSAARGGPAFAITTG